MASEQIRHLRLERQMFLSAISGCKARMREDWHTVESHRINRETLVSYRARLADVDARIEAALSAQVPA